MKTKVMTSILLSTLFYTTLLSTTFVMPLMLATHGEGAAAARDEQVWERSVKAPAAVERQRDQRPAQADTQVSEPAAKRAPLDKSGPDAQMIKAGKVRAKTIKA